MGQTISKEIASRPPPCGPSHSYTCGVYAQNVLILTPS